MSRDFNSLIILSFLHFICSSALGQSDVFPFSYQNHFGLVSSAGQIILEPKYDRIDLFLGPKNNNYTLVTLNSLYGLIDKKGTEIIAPTLNQLEYNGNQGFAWNYDNASNSMGLHLYSLRKKQEIASFDSLRVMEVFGHHTFFALLMHKKTGKMILLNEEGKQVIQLPQGSEITFLFQDEPCPLVKVGSGMRPKFYDCNGISTTYEEYSKIHHVETVSENISDKEIDNSSIYSSTSANTFEGTFIPPEGMRLQSIISKNNIPNSIIAYYKDHYGLVDTKGNELLPFRFALLKYLVDDFILSVENSYRGIYNIKGKVIIQPIFQMIEFDQRHQGFFMVYTMNGYFGYADKQGHVFLPEIAFHK